MISFQQLQEGVYDKNIFKAIFLAGGPGSGKSFVARKTMPGLGLKNINSDTFFEKLIKDADIDLDFRSMNPDETKRRDEIRAKAKGITQRQTANFVAGRLGIIIDGTGAKYDTIARQSQALKGLGYDTYMVFVNTSLDNALEQNRTRRRKLPDDLVKEYWNSVQNNIGKYQRLFGAKNFIVVDNNNRKDDLYKMYSKPIKRFVTKKVENYLAKQWIDNQLRMKKIMGQSK